MSGRGPFPRFCGRMVEGRPEREWGMGKEDDDEGWGEEEKRKGVVLPRDCVGAVIVAERVVSRCGCCILAGGCIEK